MNEIKKFFASVVSEIGQSDIYLTIRARLFEATTPNLNGCRVTEAFLDEIVANQDKYIALPLYADIKNLTSGNYKNLGHMYDRHNDTFMSTQIGSFYNFEKEVVDGHCYLVGYARVAKRNKAICSALTNLFCDGALKFSFEISVGAYTDLDDGTILIDASEKNFIEGEAVVSFPACEDAVALDLVAECSNIGIANKNANEELKMTDEKIIETQETIEEVAEVESSDTVVAETVEQTEVVGQDTIEAEVANIAERKEKCEAEDDPEEEKPDDKKEPPFEKGKPNPKDDPKDDPKEKEDPEEEASCKKKCAEESISENAELLSMIGEIKKTIESIVGEIETLKSAKTAVAEHEVASVNPFMDNEMNMASSKYSLLESEKKNTTKNYTLLDRA